MQHSQRSVTIIGFGSQAKAWALNLRDSKIDLNIALHKESKSTALAQSLGFKTILLPSEELKKSSLVVLLIPDDQQAQFLADNVNFLTPGTHLVYAHGFAVSKFQLDKKYPQFKHSLLAPKAIASEVRLQYETKGKIGAAMLASDKEAREDLEFIAKNVGFTALYESNFDEETKADLFSEQALLCSILPYASLNAFNILRKNGVAKEVAFMECYLELASISKAIVSKGPEAFFNLISPNALIGAQKGRELLIDAEFERKLESLFADINSKKFYSEVEIDFRSLRNKMVDEWNQEELTKVFNELKADLIND